MSLKALANYDKVPRGEIRNLNTISSGAPIGKVSAKKPPRKNSRCIVCGLSVRIKADGTTYKHGSKGIACNGSNHLPTSTNVACPDCGISTAYYPQTMLLSRHYLTGSRVCDAGGMKIIINNGKAYHE